MATPWNSFHTIIERIFNVEDEKRIEDKITFQRFLHAIDMHEMREIHETLQGDRLFDHHTDTFDKIDYFYSLPSNKYHSAKLQEKSIRFWNAYREMTEFTTINFSYPYPKSSVITFLYGVYDREEISKRSKELEFITKQLGRSYIELYDFQKWKHLTNVEKWIYSIIMLMAVGFFAKSIYDLIATSINYF